LVLFANGVKKFYPAANSRGTVNYEKFNRQPAANLGRIKNHMAEWFMTVILPLKRYQ
jgi:hypothetical protein